jgi:DegV family protein with EDD domain
MSKVAIVTDSTAYLPPDYVEKYHITVAPQILMWGEDTYLDGVDISPTEFYKRLATAKIMPTTSQVTPKTFHEIYSTLLAQNCEILSILISTDLSGTIPSAVQAREMFPGAKIEIVDSRTVSMGLGFQVLAAARAVEAGASLAEAKAVAEEAREHVGIVLAVDTLEFLHRGGRIGGAQRFLGTALKMKPILEVTGGKVEAVERVRTRTKSLERIVELLVERIAGRKPIRLATLHANAPAEANEVLAMAQKVITPIENILAEVSPVVGTHAGPGTVGLAFMAGIE